MVSHHTLLVLWRNLTTMAASQEQHLSALSYIDKGYDDPQMKQIVHSLIQDEMAAFEPLDYLADKPAPRTRFKSPLLKSEWARVRAEKAMEPMDTSRYDLQPPQGAAAENEVAWKRSLDNARAQTEHQHNRYVQCALCGDSVSIRVHDCRFCSRTRSIIAAAGRSTLCAIISVRCVRCVLLLCGVFPSLSAVRLQRVYGGGYWVICTSKTASGKSGCGGYHMRLLMTDRFSKLGYSPATS